MQSLRSPEDILAAMSRAEKLAQLQVVWRRDFAEASALARAGIGALFWPGSAEQSNELQRVAREESPSGIPLLIGLDVVHGQFTIFPTPLAQAASFDLEVGRADAAVSATEARASGVNWTFSPMVDISRDPRWGRAVEGFGEDPFLTSAFGAAKVAAYQQRGPDGATGIAACLKHFVAYGAAEGGRDYNTTDVSNRRLRDVYLEPFRAGVAAGALSVMAAFNSLNGRPMHANRGLLTDVLKDEWGFDGLVVGDAEGVSQLAVHGVVADERAADREAIQAGLDIVMGGQLLSELADLDIADDRLDDAVLRVLRAKEALGLDDPYVDPHPAEAPTPESRQQALWAAERCPVLVKNSGAALPIGPSVRRVLLVGPYAASTDHLGTWVQHFAAPSGSLDEALAKECADIEWVVLPGSDFLTADEHELKRAVDAASTVDLIIVAAGEPSSLSGEASSRSDIRLPEAQEQLILALAAADAPVAVVLMTGRPLVVADWIDEVDALLVGWHLGTEAPLALAGILSGRVNPAGRLPMTFPRSVGQIPIHHDHEPTGRPATQRGSLATVREDVALAGPGNLDDYYTSKYLDLDLGAQFEFGHGMGYSTFELGQPRVELATTEPASLDDVIVTVTMDVTNTGQLDGDDVVLLFIADPLASLSQPVQRLRGFERITVAQGQTRQVRFVVDARALGFWTNDERFVVEAGRFDLRLSDGTQSQAASLTLATSLQEKTA